MKASTRWYYESNSLAAEVNYANGMLDGKTTWYYENKAIKLIENFHQGRLEGKSVGYDENGKIVFEEEFKEGVKIACKRYDSEGNILMSQSF